jgi:hypothetical protein
MTDEHIKYGILIFLILFLFYWFSDYFIPDQFINYNINGKIYKVLDKDTNSIDAAMLLHRIDTNLINLIDFITEKYKNLNQMDIPDKKKDIIKVIIRRLNKTYESDSLKENFPILPGKDVSYNLNKGDLISLCLRDFSNPNEFHQFNDILFVSIHELAHSCNISYGHDLSFWYIFRFLLENAVEAGIYKNVNYRNNNVNYCSMKITYNPIYDKSLNDEIYLNKI